MLLFLPSALSLETLSFFFASYTLSTYAPGYLKTRTCRISGRVSLNKAAKKSTEELSNHFALSASQSVPSPPRHSDIRLGDHRPSAHRLWAWPFPIPSPFLEHPRCAAALHLPLPCHRGSPPPSLLALPVVPWQLCCLQSQSSPVPSQTRRSAAPASTVDLLAPEPALHLGNPTTPPTAATSAAHRRPPTLPLHDRLQNSLALFVLSCRSATPAPRPHLLYRPGQLQITHTLSAAARRTPFTPRTSINLVPTSVSHPPSV